MTKSPAPSRTKLSPHVTVRKAPATTVAKWERAMRAREESVRSRERVVTAKERALQAREASVQTLADQMREANERLLVTAIRAQYLSDDAWGDAARARTEVEQLMQQMQEANERLAAVSSEARTMEKAARQREEDYRQLSSRLLQLQDEERRRLALDLHDSTAQRLAALIMNLDLLAGADILDVQLGRALTESRSLAQGCSRDVRTLAYLLHPPLLDEAGLLSAVRRYVEGFKERSGIRVDMDLDEDEGGRLPRPTEAALFRVVQESLTNVYRHTSDATASIRLKSVRDAVTLEIHDQGHGLRDDLKRENSMVSPRTLGVGIQGMRERIRQLGGTFEIEFTEEGTTVRVRVTVPDKTP